MRCSISQYLGVLRRAVIDFAFNCTGVCRNTRRDLRPFQCARGGLGAGAFPGGAPRPGRARAPPGAAAAASIDAARPGGGGCSAGCVRTGVCACGSLHRRERGARGGRGAGAASVCRPTPAGPAQGEAARLWLAPAARPARCVHLPRVCHVSHSFRSPRDSLKEACSAFSSVVISESMFPLALSLRGGEGAGSASGRGRPWPSCAPLPRGACSRAWAGPGR